MASPECRRLLPTAPVAWAVLLFLYVPVVVIVWMSFNAGPSALVWQGWGIRGYVDAAQDVTLMRAAETSTVLALMSMIVSTGIALAAAVAGWTFTSRSRGVLAAWISVPLVVPEIVLAIGTVLLFSVLSIEPGFMTVLFAHVVFCLPFAYLPISARLAKVDRKLLEAAADLSATPWVAFRQITLPLTVPGIVAGAALAFVVSMNDYVTSYFLAGAGLTTLPMYIFSALKLGLTPKINAASTAVIGVSTLQLIGIWVVRQDRNELLVGRRRRDPQTLHEDVHAKDRRRREDPSAPQSRRRSLRARRWSLSTGPSGEAYRRETIAAGGCSGSGHRIQELRSRLGRRTNSSVDARHPWRLCRGPKRRASDQPELLASAEGCKCNTAILRERIMRIVAWIRRCGFFQYSVATCRGDLVGNADVHAKHGGGNR